jgi:hypothetical protein
MAAKKKEIGGPNGFEGLLKYYRLDFQRVYYGREWSSKL